MPGLLKRSHDQVDGPGDDDVASLAPDRKRVATEQVNGGADVPAPSVNGAHGASSFPAIGIAPDPEVGADAIAAAELNPSVDIPHVTEGYVPLSTLVDRVAQETHNELEALIQELADLQSNQINGYGSAQSVQVNVQKKERIFYYAQNYRTKFIKLLVLSQWSRDSQAVSKLIDLHNWLTMRREEYRTAVSWIGELKRMTTTMKIQAPDLRTTLEVLSSNKASWISDLGYLPQKPLSRREISKTLRNINILLRIRLNLHETIPDEMMNFTIQDGRATFRVKDEFEVALSIADEDPASQLYFIDFQFAFMPCQPEIGDGPIRNYLIFESDAILKAEGLKGCYDFLHNFVLTHKLSILRNQAVKLSRGLWSNGIKVEQVHRGFVVQYWTGRPGAKNWIEMGLRKRRRKPENAHETDDPHLSMRWHMHGKEVLDHGVEPDVGELSMERILKDIIGKHTNLIFKDTKKSLKQGAIYRDGLLFVKHRAHPTESAESHLKVQLTRDKTVTLTQDPIDGSFYLAPKNSVHVQTEFELNRLRNPAADAAMRIALLRCNEVLANVNQRARMRRWLSVQTHRPNQETIRRLFKAEHIRLAFYRVLEWDPAWLLAITTSLEGDRWWLVECQDAPRNPTPMDYVTDAYQPLKRSLQLPPAASWKLVFEPSPHTLSAVERTASALLSQYVDARELAGMKIRFKQLEARKTGDIERPMLLIQLPLQPVTVRPSDSEKSQPRKSGALHKSVKPWCSNVLKSVFTGLSRPDRRALTLVYGKLARAIPHIDRFRSSLDADLAFHPTNGTFTLRLRTPVGRSIVPELRARLDQVSSLVSFIDVTARHNLDCTRIALDSLTFSYAALDRDPNGVPSTLLATILFPPNKELALALPSGNPHLRIADSLARELNYPGHGLSRVVGALRATLSLLRGFSELEADYSSPDVRVIVFSHSASTFSVRYTGRRVGFSYLVDMKYHGTDGSTIAYMHRLEIKPPLPDLLPASTSGGEKDAENQGNKDGGKKDAGKETPGTKSTNSKGKKPEPKRGLSESERVRGAQLKTVWQALCRERHEQRWMGLGAGIAAGIETARSCVLHVDQAMRTALAAADGLEAQAAPASTTMASHDGELKYTSKMNATGPGKSAPTVGATGSAAPFGGARTAPMATGGNQLPPAARAKMIKDAQARAGGGVMGRGKEIITLD